MLCYILTLYTDILESQNNWTISSLIVITAGVIFSAYTNNRIIPYLCNQLLDPTDVVHSLRNIFAFRDAFATSMGLLHEIVSCLLYVNTQLPQQCLSSKSYFTMHINQHKNY